MIVCNAMHLRSCRNGAFSPATIQCAPDPCPAPTGDSWLPARGKSHGVEYSMPIIWTWSFPLGVEVWKVSEHGTYENQCRLRPGCCPDGVGQQCNLRHLMVYISWLSTPQVPILKTH